MEQFPLFSRSSLSPLSSAMMITWLIYLLLMTMVTLLLLLTIISEDHDHLNMTIVILISSDDTCATPFSPLLISSRQILRCTQTFNVQAHMLVSLLSFLLFSSQMTFPYPLRSWVCNMKEALSSSHLLALFFLSTFALQSLRSFL